jgi:hypothetical protein
LIEIEITRIAEIVGVGREKKRRAGNRKKNVTFRVRTLEKKKRVEDEEQESIVRKKWTRTRKTEKVGVIIGIARKATRTKKKTNTFVKGKRKAKVEIGIGLTRRAAGIGRRKRTLGRRGRRKEVGTRIGIGKLGKGREKRKKRSSRRKGRVEIVTEKKVVRGNIGNVEKSGIGIEAVGRISGTIENRSPVTVTVTEELKGMMLRKKSPRRRRRGLVEIKSWTKSRKLECPLTGESTRSTSTVREMCGCSGQKSKEVREGESSFFYLFLFPSMYIHTMYYILYIMQTE